MSLGLHRPPIGLALLGFVSLLPSSCGDTSEVGNVPSGGKAGAPSGGLAGFGSSAGHSGGGYSGGEGGGESAGEGGSGGTRDSFVVSGTLQGLLGEAIVLRNAGERLTLSANGPFAFETSLPNAASFHVEVATQPSAPRQACAVVDGEGVIANTDVTNVLVRCGLLPRYLLVADALDASVSSFALDATSGRASFVGKVTSGDTPVSVAVEPAGRYAYVANNGDATISQYAVDERGKLLPLDPPTVSVDAHPNALLTDARGLHVYVAASGSDDVVVLRADAFGRLDRVGKSRVSTGTGLVALALHPNGKALYALDEQANSVTTFSIGNGDTLVQLGSAVETGPKPRAIAVDPSGRFAYVVNSGDDTLSAHRISPDGSLLPQSSKALATGRAPSSIAIDGTGTLLLVANAKQAVLSEFAVLPDGLLSALGSVGTEASSAAVAIDPTAQFAFAATPETNGLSQFAAGPTGVSAISPPRVASQKAPTALAFVTGNAFARAESRVAYVPNVSSNSVSWYAVSTTGALDWRANVPVGTEPVSVALTPDGRHAFVLNTNEISLCELAEDGAPAVRGEFPLPSASSPTDMTVHPSGRFAYVIDSVRRTVSQYAVGGEGALEKLTPAELSLGSVGRPTAIAIDPSGRFAFVSLNDDTIQQFTIALDGTLSPNATPVVSTGHGPNGLIVDVSGRYAYAATTIDGAIAQYALDAQGSLVPLVPPTVAADVYPGAISLNSVLGTAYAANADSATITQYAWAATGTLAALAPASVAAGTEGVDSPSHLATRAEGTTLYVVNSTSSGGIFQYSVNADGSLAPLSPSRVKTGALPGAITLLNQFH